MPARLPVVLSQSAAAGAERDLEESLVTDLLMQHGADVSIVRPLPQLAAGQTDLLMLEGIAGDFVLLAWQAPEEALAALETLGINGRLGATPWTEAAAGSGRRIYAFDIRRHDGRAIRQAIAGLLRDRQTPTFSLGGLPSRPSAGPSQVTAQRAADASSAAPAARSRAGAPDARRTDGDAARQIPDDSLEGLVDRLDALDL